MATKKFIIEVEEGKSKCSSCPFKNHSDCMNLCKKMFKVICSDINLATILTKECKTEKQIELYPREKKALKHCIQMAKSHIASWQFNDKREKESVRVAKLFLRKLRLLEIKELEEEQCSET